MIFSAPDNNYNTQNWTLGLTTNYYWQKDKIVEKDSCFNMANDSTVKAEGKMLYDYVQNNILISDSYLGNLSQSVFHSSRIFYFKCQDNKIESLHSCPPGFILNELATCEQIHTCTGQVDGFKFPDANSKFRYFECIHEKSVLRTCPRGELFEYDTCIVPENLCAVKSDVFLKDLTRTSFMNCVHGHPVIINCPRFTYALNGKCESEYCENIHIGLVPIKIDNGTFEFAPKYGRCQDGRLAETFECPSIWNFFESDVSIMQLPPSF